LIMDTSHMNLPGITFNEADGKVLLISQPTEGRPPVDSAMLHALLVEHGSSCAMCSKARSDGRWRNAWMP